MSFTAILRSKNKNKIQAAKQKENYQGKTGIKSSTGKFVNIHKIMMCCLERNKKCWLLANENIINSFRICRDGSDQIR